MEGGVPAAGSVAREADLAAFCRSVLGAAGADVATAEAASDAMMHGSLLGVDSHGVRLLGHYVKGIAGGRINLRPDLRLVQERGAVAVLDADDAQGALAAYRGMEHACRIARQFGVGAVSIRRTSHFGPAGAFALRAAETGLIGLAVANSDSFVRLHDGAARFHGTNPLAMAVPLAGEEPWLLDMATSAITYNRVQLLKGLNRPLPAGVASRDNGEDTTDPHEASMLAPLGAEYGFKGAGLAGLVEILSAVLSGMRLSHEIAPMGGPDFSTPREMGAFVLALDPGFFLGAEQYEQGLRRYLADLRQSPAREGFRVLAPGDRGWEEGRRRRREGIPLDPATVAEFRQLAADYGVEPPLSG